MPGQHSTMAEHVDALFYFIYYSSAILLLLVTAAIIYFVLRYRRRSRQGELTSGVAHNTKLEIAWTVIPSILVFIIFAWGFRDFLRLYIVPKDAIEVKVTGQRWFWSFDYPDGVTSVNDLTVPVGKPVKLLLSSRDVIHSFFVPNFRIKMDALPNRYTVAWFEATDTGSYNLFCTEYCGTKHSAMIGKVHVVGEREFAAWMEAGSMSGEGMSLEDFGAKLYASKACITCHSVDGKAGTGPTFKGAFGHSVKFTDGREVTADENYLRESILNPQAKIVAGYQPVMPTFQGILKDKQVDALVAYIKSLKNGEAKK